MYALKLVFNLDRLTTNSIHARSEVRPYEWSTVVVVVLLLLWLLLTTRASLARVVYALNLLAFRSLL